MFFLLFFTSKEAESLNIQKLGHTNVSCEKTNISAKSNQLLGGLDQRCPKSTFSVVTYFKIEISS